MSLVITVTPRGGTPTDVTGYLRDGMFRVSRSLGSDGASCSFSLVGDTGRIALADVLATWDGAPTYRGQVLRLKRSTAGPVIFSVPECADAVIRMRRRLAAVTFTDTAADAILTSLLETYMPEATPVIQPMPMLLSFPFNYVPLSEAIKRVAEAAGAYWTLLPDDTVRAFVTSFDGATVPEYTPENILGDSLAAEEAAAEFSNRVWVLGAKQASAEYKTQTYSGASDVFNVAYEPNYTEVRVNGISAKTMLKENADGTALFVVDKKRKLVEARTELLPTDTVEIKYRPTVEVVDYMENPASVDIYGLYETVIRDQTITEKAAARMRGRAALRRATTTLPVLSWQTDGDWQVYPGQRVRVVYPQLGIDAYCRLTDVEVTFRWLGHKWRVVASMRAEVLA
ncbi:MAG TPA: hypothetical protein VD902_11425 [Symbiobacteriaceae bacterium]|nr:hypothetical protein [Symbiobacteriaceae bacterium]